MIGFLILVKKNIPRYLSTQNTNRFLINLIRRRICGLFLILLIIWYLCVANKRIKEDFQ